MFQKKPFKKLISNLLLVAIVVMALTNNNYVLASNTSNSALPYPSESSSTSIPEYGLAQNVKDGSILHAWCWSFNTIRSNLKNIAEAGYTSIQTSPITTCAVGNNGDLKFTEQWYYHYQPTDFTIGNYQLGTEGDFELLCQEAEQYGINIIVDAVTNHCASSYSSISNNVKNIPGGAFHPYNTDIDYNNRRQVTQNTLLKLNDLNTQNPNVQNYIKAFLQKAVSLGADGFRYDTAKHIELPDDRDNNGYYGSNFWPNILNNGSKFQYGEVLQDSTSRESEYTKYLGVTASSYGQTLRGAIGNNNFNSSNLVNWRIEVDSSKIVTWVESHDTYANSIHEYNTSQWLTDDQIKLAWAIVGSRAAGTPLFFSRPVEGGGKNWDNRFPEKSKIGDIGSSLFMDDEVTAVNKFRNAMIGESENLSNPSGDSKVLMIQRGNKGVVIVNLNSNSYTLNNAATQLADGTYTNQTDDNSTFTVANGKISGTLPSRCVTVLYKTTPAGPSVSISDTAPTFHTDSLVLTLHQSNSVYAQYSVNGGESKSFIDGDKVTIGTGDAYGTQYVVNLTATDAANTSVTKSYSFTKSDSSQTTIYYMTNKTANIHYKVNTGNWTTAPGVAMSSSDYSGYKVANIDLGTGTSLKACFNDGNGNWDNNKGIDYNFGVGIYTVINGVITEGKPSILPSNTITLYYKTSYPIAYIHYKVGSTTWTTAPGLKMGACESIGYQKITISLGESTTLTACFNNGNGTWDNNSGKDYYFNAPGNYTIANGNIINSVPNN